MSIFEPKKELNNYQILVRARKMINNQIRGVDKNIEKIQQSIGDLVIRDKNHPTDMASTVIMAIEQAQINIVNAKREIGTLVWVLGLLKRKE